MVVVALVLCLSACSSAPHAGKHLQTTTSTTAPVHQATLASLPMAHNQSSTYPRLFEAHGTGDKSLGAVAVKGTRIYVQTVCKGPGSLQLVKLFAQGPCNGEAGVTSFDAPASRRLTITVRASAKTRWAIYITQPA